MSPAASANVRVFLSGGGIGGRAGSGLTSPLSASAAEQGAGKVCRGS